MIDGRILISTAELDRWIQEAIETDVERSLLIAEAQTPPDQSFARMRQTGWARIESLLDDHCVTWSFGAKDRKRIVGVVRPIYEEARKFLDLPA